ncbi:MAG TPA: hypothetical protein VIL51_12905 [Thermoleophilia bacterium]
MGNLTDDMTRLRGEVDALRSDRGALMQALSRGVNDLASSVSAMRADFGAAHAAMAEEARNSRAAFVSTMSGEVNAFLADCRKARGEMAVEGSERRAAFCAGMQKYVAGMCMETADDLAGARLAWSGRGSRIRRERRSPKEHRAVEAPRSDGKSLSATSPGRRKKVDGADRSGAPHSVKKLATKSKRTKRLSK